MDKLPMGVDKIIKKKLDTTKDFNKYIFNKLVFFLAY